MASTYTTNQGLEKPATGDRSGTWGTMTNTNMDMLDRSISGVGALSLTGTTTTLTTTDGSASDGNYKVLVLGGSPSDTNTITLSPNDGDKLYFVVNATGESVIFSQGTGANVTIANGAADIIYADGAGSGAAVASLLANDLVFKTGDGVILNLQTSDTTVTAASVLGRLNFTAPDEASGTDAILLAASIAAISEGTFAADNNATKLSFLTGASAAASEVMSISSVGNVTMKQTATTDDTPMTLLLQTGELDVAASDVLGKIEFQAPDEATGTDAILVAGAIDCVSEGDFSSSSNASKLSFRTGASETATEKMTISSAGDIAFTVSDGAAVTGVASINSSQIGVRNLLINGEMRVAQRATSATGIGNGSNGYHVCDRWRWNEGGSIQTVITMSQDTDVPSGKGFSNSLKLDVTTAEGAVAADERIIVDQVIEGQDLTQLKYGTSSAASLTISFWIKTTKTGTYVLGLYNGSPSTDRIFSKTYTVDAADTWEKKTLTWVGDTDSDSAFTDSNAGALWVQWWFLAGSNFTDGTLTSAWVDFDDGVWADAMVNTFDSTSNNVYLTGFQVESGSTATEYEHRTYANDLQQCQRYYQFYGGDDANGFAAKGSGHASYYEMRQNFLPTYMRATATVTKSGTFVTSNTGEPSAWCPNPYSLLWQSLAAAAGAWSWYSNSSGKFALDAEL